MDPLKKALTEYAQEVARLAAAQSTNEATYYPALENEEFLYAR